MAKNINASYAIRFNQTEMVLQAAIEGQGVALSTSVIAENDIKAWSLNSTI